MSDVLPVQLLAGGHTQPGLPRDNEDYLLSDTNLGVFAVLDAGGSWHEDGEGSRIGAAAIQRVIARERLTEPSPLIELAFREAAETLRMTANGDGLGKSTRVVLALFRDGRIHVSWIGHCAAHRVSDKQINSLTEAHTLGNDMMRAGTLTAERAEQFNPNLLRIWTHSLGGTHPEPLEMITFAPVPGDRLILTTDGVHNTLAPSVLLTTCQTHPEPQECDERLVGLAREQGSRDDYTCIVLAFEEASEAPPTEPPKPYRPWWQFWRRG